VISRRRPSFFQFSTILSPNSSNSSSVGVPSLTRERNNCLQITVVVVVVTQKIILIIDSYMKVPMK